MNRTFQDALLKKSKALPAAAAANYTDSIDLGVTNLSEGQVIEAEIAIPATPSLVDDKTITLTLKDSADNETFAALDGVSTVVRTGAGGAGAAAKTLNVFLPRGTRRYVRLDAAVLAAGGDNTAISYSLALQPVK